jgi:signal peptidase I
MDAPRVPPPPDPGTALPELPRKAPRRRSRVAGPLGVLGLFACGTVLFAFLTLFVAAFFVSTYQIPSGSMEPTLRRGQLVIGSKRAYKSGDPQRGDIAVFIYPEDRTLLYMKRVIGLPGDTVELKDGQVLVNGAALVEPYIKEQAYADFGPETVPAGCYFVLGDNRNHSSDSRVWGWVSRANFVAKVLGK